MAGTDIHRVGGPSPLVVIVVSAFALLIALSILAGDIRSGHLFTFTGMFMTVWVLLALRVVLRLLRSPRHVEVTARTVRFVRWQAASVEVPWTSLSAVQKRRGVWHWTWDGGDMVMMFPPDEPYRLLRAIEERAPHVQLTGM